MAKPTLKLTVTLNTFLAQGTGFCTATTTASGWGNSNGKRVKVKGKGKPVDIVFTILNGIPGSNDVYWPSGISFVGAPGNPDPSGALNFSDASCAQGNTNVTPNVPGTLTVTDANFNHGPGAAAPVWESYITVVRLSDLAAGVIDPGIENSDDALVLAVAAGGRKAKPAPKKKP